MFNVGNKSIFRDINIARVMILHPMDSPRIVSISNYYIIRNKLWYTNYVILEMVICQLLTSLKNQNILVIQKLQNVNVWEMSLKYLGGTRCCKLNVTLKGKKLFDDKRIIDAERLTKPIILILTWMSCTRDIYLIGKLYFITVI